MSEMIFYFKALGDELKLTEVKNKAYTGNVNSYICEFDLSEDWDGLSVFAVFSGGDDAYTVLLSEDMHCKIPVEMLSAVGTCAVGLFGTNASEDNLMRISTGLRRIHGRKCAERACSRCVGGAYVENDSKNRRERKLVFVGQ